MVRMGWSWTSSTRTSLLLLVGTVVGMIAVLIAWVTLLSAVLPRERAAMQVRDAIPLGVEFAEINKVSRWPADWINAVCQPPLYQLRNYTRLPHALVNASCRSLKTPTGDIDYLMISRFPSELPMQVDLHNEGYKYYAFAYDHGSLISFETTDDTRVPDPVTNLGESPILLPLKQFGFHIYADPGPP
jgi:hypothetical protein